MDYGLLSCLPILVLIIGGFATKRMTEMIMIASVIGSVIIYRADFFNGYITLLYEVLSDESYQFILILLMTVGGMIRLFEKSGVLKGFEKKLERFASTPARSLLTAWLLTIVMFIDDYLCLLTVSSSVRSLTDRQRVPREHLAYTVNSMSVSICLLIPFTSWSVFAITNLTKEGMGFAEYVHSIRYMFYPAASVVVSLLLAAGLLPKIGGIRRAYERVEAGGPLIPENQTGEASVVDTEEEGQTAAPSAVKEPRLFLNFAVPLIILVTVMMICDRSIIHGVLAALVYMLLAYRIQGVMTVSDYLNAFFEGMKRMTPIAFVILFAYMIAKENDLMGFAPFLVNSLSSVITPGLMPLFVFLIMSVVAFTIGDIWALILISMPIFIPMARNMGVPLELAIGAILSGANLGAVTCLQSDALFMTYAGTGVPNITQVKSGLPYTALTALLACLGFLVAGFL